MLALQTHEEWARRLSNWKTRHGRKREKPLMGKRGLDHLLAYFQLSGEYISGIHSRALCFYQSRHANSRQSFRLNLLTYPVPRSRTKLHFQPHQPVGIFRMINQRLPTHFLQVHVILNNITARDKPMMAWYYKLIVTRKPKPDCAYWLFGNRHGASIPTQKISKDYNIKTYSTCWLWWCVTSAMAEDVGLGASIERFSIIIRSEAEESGEVWMPISLLEDDPQEDGPVLVVISNLADEMAAASAAALVRLAHLNMCVCKMM